MNLKIKGKVKENIPASYITSMRAGGNIRYLVYPADEEDVYTILDFCKRKGFNYYIMGNGTNLIFTDAGFLSFVVSTRAINNIKQEGDDIFCAGSGILLPEMVAHTSRNGFTGIESLIGIPGTLGGGVVMNAGSYGQEIGNVFYSASILKERNIISVSKDKVKFWYRGSNLDKMGIILKICLKLNKLI